MKWWFIIIILIIQNNKVVAKVNQVNVAIINNCHLIAVQKFYMENFFFLVNLFGLFVNYLVEKKILCLIYFDEWFEFCIVDKLLTISDLDPIRRYLPPSDRPKPNSRYSSIQVDFISNIFSYFDFIRIRIQCVINIQLIYLNQWLVNRMVQKNKLVDQWYQMYDSSSNIFND